MEEKSVLGTILKNNYHDFVNLIAYLYGANMIILHSTTPSDAYFVPYLDKTASAQASKTSIVGDILYI